MTFYEFFLEIFYWLLIVVRIEHKNNHKALWMLSNPIDNERELDCGRWLLTYKHNKNLALNPSSSKWHYKLIRDSPDKCYRL